MLINIKSIKQWITLAAQLKTAKKLEMALRKEINNEILGKDKIGTMHAAFGEIEVTCSVTDSLSVGKEDLMVNQKYLTEQEKGCIVWKPSIDKAKYKKLPKDCALRQIVVMKLDAPTVKAVNLEV